MFFRNVKAAGGYWLAMKMIYRRKQPVLAITSWTRDWYLHCLKKTVWVTWVMNDWLQLAEKKHEWFHLAGSMTASAAPWKSTGWRQMDWALDQNFTWALEQNGKNGSKQTCTSAILPGCWQWLMSVLGHLSLVSCLLGWIWACHMSSCDWHASAVTFVLCWDMRLYAACSLCDFDPKACSHWIDLDTWQNHWGKNGFVIQGWSATLKTVPAVKPLPIA